MRYPENAMSVINKIYDAYGLGRMHLGSDVSKCNCGRAKSGIEARCVMCLTHELEEMCGNSEAIRLMLAAQALARAQTSVLWQAAHGRGEP